MKDIKNYLHLYYGAQIFYPETSEYSIFSWTHFLSMEQPDYNIHWKLVLRNLSDMTEEEAIELVKLTEWEPHFRDVKAERNKFNDWIVSWNGMPESREVFNATGEQFYCSEQLLWLLSKNFDFFDLIGEGLAIDKTQTPKEPMLNGASQVKLP